MNKRTISRFHFSRIPAMLLILNKAVAAGTTTGTMAAITSLTTSDAPPAGNASALPFHPRHTGRNKTMAKGG
jgi:hypothetical protein